MLKDDYKEVCGRLIRDIHENIIIPVGKRKISVDEGYGRLVQKVYGLNNYMSLTWSEKLNFIATFAYVSHMHMEGMPHDYEYAFGYDLLDLENHQN